MLDIGPCVNVGSFVCREIGEGGVSRVGRVIFWIKKNVAIVVHVLSIAIFECLCDVRIGMMELSQNMLEVVV